MESGLSLRMERALSQVLPLFTAAAQPRLLDPHAPPIIDVSTAQNDVLQSELLEFFRSIVEDRVTSEVFALPAPRLNGGDPTLRAALASFFNTYFNPIHRVEPEHIVITVGASAAIENLVHAICDDGDSVLVPGPYWPSLDPLLLTRPNVSIIPASPPSYENWDNYLLPSLQAAYDFSANKSRIKAVLICNPNTPLGRCYPKKTLLELMEFCQERGLHLIFDEVFALMGLGGDEEGGGSGKGKEKVGYVSALSLTEPLVPEGAVKVDPSRVHVVWSASKLFGIAGLQIGCILTQSNPALHTALSILTSPSSSSTPTPLSTLYLTALLTWSQLPTLLALNSDRLTSSFRLLIASLRKWNVDYVTPTHGTFLFAKLAKRAKSAEDEKAFFERLEAAGVRVAQGRGFRGVEGEWGWGRVGFGFGGGREVGDVVGRLETFFARESQIKVTE